LPAAIREAIIKRFGDKPFEKWEFRSN